jgi:citrate lyase subunit beta/citryl-CoA lyase
MSVAEQTDRPRRSVLFVPASNPRALAKVRELDCDGVVLDLEDSAAPEAKAAAREAAREAIAEGFGRRELVVRCNGLDTPWGAEDLAMAAAAGPDAVLAPKVRSAEDVAAIEKALAGAPARTRIWAMIETPAAVLALGGIAAAAARTRLQALVLGPNDLSAELRLRKTSGRTVLHPILSQIVVAARAHGLIALGGAFNAFENQAGFEAECHEDAAFGFDGKTLIHPRQIEAANRIFSPSPAEIAWAEAVVAAFGAPEAEGKGAIRLGSEMIERLHLRDAERILHLRGR